MNNTNHLTLSNLNLLRNLLGQERQRQFDNGTSVHTTSVLQYLDEVSQNLQSTYNALSEQRLSERLSN
jgi:hypothetical protein